MTERKRARKLMIDLDAQPSVRPDLEISDRPDLIVDLGNARPPSFVKVVAVGHGGIKAAQALQDKGYADIDYVACDTDAETLAATTLPVRLQLGNTGVGTGTDVSAARDIALADTDKLIRALAGNTKLLFLLAGYGGGVGTGVTPVIARLARQLGMIAVAVISTPFLFEDAPRIDAALEGLRTLHGEVDALFVVNDEKLRLRQPDLSLLHAFSQADLALAEPIASFSSIIYTRGLVDLDLESVCTFLAESGVGFHAVGYARGAHRVTRAIEDALRQPSVGDFDLYAADRLLIHLSFGSKGGDAAPAETQELTIDEISEINRFTATLNDRVETRWGLSVDDTLGDYISVTLVAAGYSLTQISGMQVHLDTLSTAAERERTEREAERRRRLESFYGIFPSAPPSVSEALVSPSASATYLFRPSDLDNPDVIRMVESSAPVCRTPDLLDDIDRCSRAAVTHSSQTDPQSSQRHA